jgi:FAD:protein FMN transferase
MKRRAFLTSTRPGVALADESLAYPGEAMLVRFSRRAMATTFEIAMPFGTPDAYPAAEEALDVIDDLESQLTIYRESSEVSELNRSAVHGFVPVEESLFQLLSHCADLTRETAGGFDVAIGNLTQVWGFTKREGRIPNPAELRVARENSGFRHVALDAEKRSVKYLRSLSINLGSIGKGYALDRATRVLREKWGITSALLHGGGSSIYALGHPPENPRGWPVAIQHPGNPRKKLTTVYLKNQGMGTSAATFQFFVYNNRRYGHVLDPRTGTPAQGTRSASIIAPTAATADALSTAFFVRGLEAARQYLPSRPELTAVILPDSSENPTIFPSDYGR